MSLYIKRNMIVPAEFAPLARALAAHLAGPPAEGMWQTGLSPTGEQPATHYVSSGAVAEEFDPLLTDADALWGAVQQAQQTGMVLPADAPAVTQADCVALVEAAEIVDLDGATADGEEGTAGESPFETFERLGLQLINQPEN